MVAVSATSSPLGENRPSVVSERTTGALLSRGRRSPASTKPSIEVSSMPWTWTIDEPSAAVIPADSTTRSRVPAGERAVRVAGVGRGQAGGSLCRPAPSAPTAALPGTARLAGSPDVLL